MKRKNIGALLIVSGAILLLTTLFLGRRVFSQDVFLYSTYNNTLHSLLYSTSYYNAEITMRIITSIPSVIFSGVLIVSGLFFIKEKIKTTLIKILSVSTITIQIISAVFYIIKSIYLGFDVICMINYIFVPLIVIILNVIISSTNSLEKEKNQMNYLCPNCRNTVKYGQQICNYCSQVLNWRN